MNYSILVKKSSLSLSLLEIDSTRNPVFQDLKSW